jgi:molybdopterin/thiamine biosynthesis adenylyltransferase
MVNSAAGLQPGPGSSALDGFLYEEAFSRNLGLVSAAEQRRIREARVAIAGLGGVGGAHALALARLGVGRFSLADFDVFEVANFNRQVGATVATVSRAKVEVMAEAIRAINPAAELRLFTEGVNESNIDAFLDGAAAAVDGVDFFNMEARRLLFRRARQRGVPALTAAPIGFGATLHVFTPDGMSFDEYFDIRPGMTLPEQLVQFGLGLAPRLVHLRYFPPSALDLSGRRAPSMGSACLLAAVLVCTEVANLILGRRPTRAAPYFFQFDPLVQAYKKGRLRWGNRHPVQRLKRWWVLRTNPSLRAAIAAARS